MTRLLAVFLGLFICTQVYSQFGLRTYYNSNQMPGLEQSFNQRFGNQVSIFKSSYSIAVDYWLRLPNHRVEFYPNFSFHKASESIAYDQSNLDLQLNQYGLGMDVQVYLFDLVGDCECPTFSKQGGIFKKGFFLLAGGSMISSSKKYNEVGQGTDLGYNMNIGIGFDIGVSDLITISPIFQHKYHPNISWEGLNSEIGSTNPDPSSSLRQWQFGLRIGFRPDY